MPRHGTADAMAMGLQGELPSAPRWGIGADPVPSPEQQGANLFSLVQGFKGFKPVVSPTATPEEQAKTAEAARIAAQGSQLSVGWDKVKAFFSPAPPKPTAAPSPNRTATLAVAAVAAAVVLIVWAGGNNK